MAVESVTSFESMMAKIQAFPLWVKQVIFVQLRQELECSLAKATLDTLGIEDTLPLFKPQLTLQAKQELQNPTRQLSRQLMQLLSLAGQRKNLLTICIMNNWTLEQAACLLLEAQQLDFITDGQSAIVQGTLEYLGNQIRLGEYLVKIGRITVDQLDQALRTQRYIEEAMGEKTGIANVLINLGFVSKQDCLGVLFLKEESRKSFTLQPAS